MVSKYIKALALTAVILAFGLVEINYLDDMRAKSLERIVDEGALELQASQQLFLYESVFGDEDVCSIILKRVESQKLRASKVLSELEAANSGRLFPGDSSLKKKFLLQNVELYLLANKAILECGDSSIYPVVYFYPDEYYCADCASQALVLDSIVSKCQSVRVFAFPTDLNIPVIELLEAKYGVKSVPTVIAGNEK